MTLNPQFPSHGSSNNIIGNNYTPSVSTNLPQINLVCAKHDQPAFHICTAKQCENRILCSDCCASHPDKHKSRIATTHELFGSDLYMEIEEEIYLNRITDQKNDVFLTFLSQVQLSLQEVKKRIEKTIDSIDAKIKGKVMNYVKEPLFSTRDWEKYKYILGEKRTELGRGEDLKKKLDEYLAVYSEVTMAVADSNNSRELTKRHETQSLEPLELDQELIDDGIVALRGMLNKMYLNICQQISPSNTPAENMEATKSKEKPYKSALAAFQLAPFFATKPLNTSYNHKASSIASMTQLKEKTILERSISSKAFTDNPWKPTDNDDVFMRKTTAAFIYDEYVPTAILDLPYVGPIKLDDGSTYKGQMKNNKPCGKGKKIWKDGRVFEGYFRDGIIEGKGRMTHPDSDVYEGQWQNNVASGKGKYIRADGWTYEGDWVKDQPHGNGIEVWPDGTKYEGEYKSGLKHGKGLLRCFDGAFYTGEFKDNMFDGDGTYIWVDGRKFEGKWARNSREGRGVMVWPDGRRYGGEFVADKRHGYGAYDWGDGKKYVGNWKDGKPHGQGRLQHANGEILEGEWREGRLGHNGQYAAISIKELKTVRDTALNKSMELSDYSRQSMDKLTLRGLEISNQMESIGAANNYSVRSVGVDGFGDKKKDKGAMKAKPDLKISIKQTDNAKPLNKKDDNKNTTAILPIAVKEERRLSGYKIQIHEKN